VRIVFIAAGNCAATVLTAIRKSTQVAQAATASRRAASGSNDRLSIQWREVISLAGGSTATVHTIVSGWPSARPTNECETSSLTCRARGPGWLWRRRSGDATTLLEADWQRKTRRPRTARRLFPPILFRFPLHRRSRRILELQPVRRSPRPVARSQPLRNDPSNPILQACWNTTAPSGCSRCSFTVMEE
jgi:hypothetical protein